MRLIHKEGSPTIGKVLVLIEMDLDEFAEFEERIRLDDRRVDPPDCGCLGCMDGFSRPAINYEEYRYHAELTRLLAIPGELDGFLARLDNIKKKDL